MKNKKSGIFATLFFTVISILFVAPIFVVLMNSFKRKDFYQSFPIFNCRTKRVMQVLKTMLQVLQNMNL